MKISFLSFAELSTGWKLDELHLRPQVNLLVGASGAGKSRIINVLVNMARFVVEGDRKSGAPPIKLKMMFEHRGVFYSWYTTSIDSGQTEKYRIVHERIERRATTDAEVEVLLDRSEEAFTFNGKDVPRLDSTRSAITLLKEEESIAPLFEAFSFVIDRKFYGADLGAAMSIGVPADVDQTSSDDWSKPRASDPVNLRLWWLFKKDVGAFNKVKENFCDAFPFVEEMHVRQVNKFKNFKSVIPLPLVQIREKNSDTWIAIHDISSGMQKVLLILTDIVWSTAEHLYVMEEYENSLGINAIDVLPNVMTTIGEGRQFLVTTHHPNLINSIPVANWIIISRVGVELKAISGGEVESRYAKSKHQRFIQLINDPIYRGSM